MLSGPRVMGKTKKGATSSSLGRALVNDKSKRDKGRFKEDGWLHTSELDDGYDWGRLNLQSVTEESNLNAFLNTAQLAGTEFTAERQNISFVDDDSSGLPSATERVAILLAQEENKQYLSVPRRPKWDSNTSSNKLAEKERDNFLVWRRNLAKLQENEKLILTPFEKNLEFWRQLWRVIERSDVVVQIVDSRNPLLFRCEDLEKYVKEISSLKCNMVLLSKADLLTPLQRKMWADYMDKEGVPYAFWSAHMEGAKLGIVSVDNTCRRRDDSIGSCSLSEELMESDDHEDELILPKKPRGFALEDECETVVDDVSVGTQFQEPTNTCTLVVAKDKDDNSDAEDDTMDAATATTDQQHGIVSINTAENSSPMPEITDDAKLDDLEAAVDTSALLQSNHAATTHGSNSTTEANVQSCGSDDNDSVVSSRTELLTRDELLDLFRSLCTTRRQKKVGEPYVVGMVGYPNVGKSSTINTLILEKKVPVSATPGRTKHFQTLYAADDIMLCDCPGLVFPSFLSTKAEMVCSGILPIDQMRDCLGPVSLVCQRIPRPILNTTYGLMLPRPGEGEDETRPVYASELLSAYAYVRGFMTSHGQPDCSRASRHILKDYVTGKLLYGFPPPLICDDVQPFNPHLSSGEPPTFPPLVYDPQQDNLLTSQVTRKNDADGTMRNADSAFLYQERVGVHSKGALGRKIAGYHGDVMTEDDSGTSWGRISMSSDASHNQKQWKKHFNKHKKEKTRRVMKRVVDI